MVIYENKTPSQEMRDHLAELSKKNLSQDYSLGDLIRESTKLTVGKGMLAVTLDEDQDLKAKVIQAVDDRLNALYQELDRRERVYDRVVDVMMGRRRSL